MYPKDLSAEGSLVTTIALASCVCFSRVPVVQIQASVVNTDLERLASAALQWMKTDRTSLDSVEKYNRYMEAHGQFENALADLLHNCGLLYDSMQQSLSTPLHPSDEGE